MHQITYINSTESDLNLANNGSFYALPFAMCYSIKDNRATVFKYFSRYSSTL